MSNVVWGEWERLPVPDGYAAFRGDEVTWWRSLQGVRQGCPPPVAQVKVKVVFADGSEHVFLPYSPSVEEGLSHGIADDRLDPEVWVERSLVSIHRRDLRSRTDAGAIRWGRSSSRLLLSCGLCGRGLIGERWRRWRVCCCIPWLLRRSSLKGR